MGKNVASDGIFFISFKTLNYHIVVTKKPPMFSKPNCAGEQKNCS